MKHIFSVRIKPTIFYKSWKPIMHHIGNQIKFLNLDHSITSGNIKIILKYFVLTLLWGSFPAFIGLSFEGITDGFVEFNNLLKHWQEKIII